jgi:hypothetical protein
MNRMRLEPGSREDVQESMVVVRIVIVVSPLRVNVAGGAIGGWRRGQVRLVREDAPVLREPLPQHAGDVCRLEVVHGHQCVFDILDEGL